ncbi:hypothetical protein HK101_008441 [Irineochytrium annulatum]|nr:hypothetical protein HK101_008441 [Irineochytrium annulatum]
MTSTSGAPAAITRRRPLNIAIITSGFIGPVLALLLKRIGHRPVLFEAADNAAPGSSSSTGMGGFSLAVNGLRVFRNLGLLDGLHAIGSPSSRGDVRKHTGKLITTFPTTTWRDRYGLVNVGVRGDRLRSFLLDECRRGGVAVHSGRRLEGIRQPADVGALGATARFEGGMEYEADVIVGADGLGSRTRRVLMGDMGTGPVFTGVESIVGITRAEGMKPLEDPSGRGTSWDPTVSSLLQGKGRQFGMFGVGMGEVVWFVEQRGKETDESWNVRTGDDVRGASTGDRGGKVLGAIVKGFKEAGVDERFVEVVKRSEVVMRYGIYDEEPIKQWSKGNVVLIGDSAHPMSPHLGQGSNSALEDAGMLSELIHHLVPDVPPGSSPSNPSDATAMKSGLSDAFSTLQRLRYGRVMDLTRSARDLGELNLLESAFLRSARDMVIRATVGIFGAPPMEGLFDYDYVAEVEKELQGAPPRRA